MTTVELDPRLHPYREDLAAETLRGVVEAPCYAPGVRHQAAAAVLPMRRTPSVDAGLDTEMLFGETITVFDVAGGWAWGQLERDGYVGYVPVDGLSTDVVEATHRISALGTWVYPQPDIKSPAITHLSINTPLAVEDVGERFSRLATGGFVMSRHIAPKGRSARDFVEIAERMIDTPYLWGGRTRLGLDCSGLVQVAMEAAGLPCPRDSDMQEQDVWANVLIPESLEGLQRGDLVFWRGHVGIMADGVMLVHANAHHMAVVVEPLTSAAQRILKTGSEITSIKRPAALSA